MANTIRVKRSATPSKVPTTTDLALGEIGINTFDGKVYIKKDNGTASIVEVTGGGGGGATALSGLSDVTITSATTNDLLKYNGTKWVNSASLAASQVTGLATVATTGAYSDLSGKPTLVTNLDGLSDVAITSVASGQFLVYDGTNFVNTRTISSGGSTPLTTVSSGGTSAEFKSSAGYNGFRVGCDGSTGVPYVALDTASSQKAYFAYWGDGAARVALGYSSSTDVITYGTGGTYEGRVGIKTATPLGQLGVACASSSNKGIVVKGAASQSANLLELQDSSGNVVVSVNPSGDVTLNNVTINGTTTTVNSTTVTIDDPIFTVGGDTAPTSDDNKDRGIEFRWHNGSAAKVGFFGYDDSASKFTCFSDATNTSEVFAGTRADAVFNTVESSVATGTAPLTVASTTVVTNLNADTVDGYHADTFILPSGVMMAYGGSAAPSGWLLCDGSAVSRTTYAGLFTAIGTSYGTGDGSTTFTLPDLRRRVPVGKGSADSLGDSDGVAAASRTLTHTHSVPAHHHAMGTGADLNITSSGSGTTGSDGAHSHTINYRQTPSAFGSGAPAGASGTGTLTTWPTTTDGAHTHTTPNHTHGSAAFSGKIGLVTGGVDGNAAMTSGTSNANYLITHWIIKT